MWTIFIIAAIGLAQLASGLQEKLAVCPVTRLNVRSTPANDGTVVWVTTPTERFDEVGARNGGWWNIKSRSSGQTGWASGEFLAPCFEKQVLWLTSAGKFTVERFDRTGRRSRIPQEQAVDKFLLHTIEGLWPRLGDWELGHRVLDDKTFWPHFIVAKDKSGKVRIGQYLPLNVGGYALRDGNRDGVIQVEIGAKAESPFTSSDAALTEAVQLLFQTVRLAEPGIRNRLPPGVYFNDNKGYGLNAPQRLSEAAFKAASGLVGHQHVYSNTHWDPGQINAAPLLVPLDLGEDDSGPLPTSCPTVGAQCAGSLTETLGTCSRTCTGVAGTCTCVSTDAQCCSTQGSCSSVRWSCLADKTVSPTTRLNIRDEPNTGGTVLWVAEPTEEFIHLDISADSGWFRLRSVARGQEGWASKDFLKLNTNPGGGGGDNGGGGGDNGGGGGDNGGGGQEGDEVCNAVGETCNMDYTEQIGACERTCHKVNSECTCVSAESQESCCGWSPDSYCDVAACSLSIKLCPYFAVSVRLEPKEDAVEVFLAPTYSKLIQSAASPDGVWFQVAIDHIELEFLKGWVRKEFLRVDSCSDDIPPPEAPPVGSRLCGIGTVDLFDAPTEDANQIASWSSSELEAAGSAIFVSLPGPGWFQVTTPASTNSTGFVKATQLGVCQSGAPPANPNPSSGPTNDDVALGLYIGIPIVTIALLGTMAFVIYSIRKPSNGRFDDGRRHTLGQRMKDKFFSFRQGPQDSRRFDFDHHDDDHRQTFGQRMRDKFFSYRKAPQNNSKITVFDL